MRSNLFLHASDRPEKIDRRRPVLPMRSQIWSKSRFEITVGFGLGIVHAQRDAHGCGHADRRCPAHHHVADDVGDLLMRLAGHVDFFGGQLRLVDEAYAVVGPFESLNHGD